MLTHINLIIAVTFPTLTSLNQPQRKDTKSIVYISRLYSPVSEALFLPEPRLACESVSHKVLCSSYYLIEVGMQDKNYLPSLIDLRICLDQISILLSTNWYSYQWLLWGQGKGGQDQQKVSSLEDYENHGVIAEGSGEGVALRKVLN